MVQVISLTKHCDESVNWLDNERLSGRALFLGRQLVVSDVDDCGWLSFTDLLLSHPPGKFKLVTDAMKSMREQAKGVDKVYQELRDSRNTVDALRKENTRLRAKVDALSARLIELCEPTPIFAVGDKVRIAKLDVDGEHTNYMRALHRSGNVKIGDVLTVKKVRSFKFGRVWLSFEEVPYNHPGEKFRLANQKQ